MKNANSNSNGEKVGFLKPMLARQSRDGREGCEGEWKFELMKHRLLLRRLDELPKAEGHALIMREAEEAAALARRTAYPLLVFPCLFEERSRAVADRMGREEQRYWLGFQPRMALPPGHKNHKPGDPHRG